MVGCEVQTQADIEVQEDLRIYRTGGYDHQPCQKPHNDTSSHSRTDGHRQIKITLKRKTKGPMTTPTATVVVVTFLVFFIVLFSIFISLFIKNELERGNDERGGGTDPPSDGGPLGGGDDVRKSISTIETDGVVLQSAYSSFAKSGVFVMSARNRDGGVIKKSQFFKLDGNIISLGSQISDPGSGVYRFSPIDTRHVVIHDITGGGGSMLSVTSIEKDTEKSYIFKWDSRQGGFWRHVGPIQDMLVTGFIQKQKDSDIYAICIKQSNEQEIFVYNIGAYSRLGMVKIKLSRAFTLIYNSIPLYLSYKNDAWFALQQDPGSTGEKTLLVNVSIDPSDNIVHSSVELELNIVKKDSESINLANLFHDERSDSVFLGVDVGSSSYLYIMPQSTTTTTGTS